MKANSFSAVRRSCEFYQLSLCTVDGHNAHSSMFLHRGWINISGNDLFVPGRRLIKLGFLKQYQDQSGQKSKNRAINCHKDVCIQSWNSSRTHLKKQYCFELNANVNSTNMLTMTMLMLSRYNVYHLSLLCQYANI